MAPIAQGYSQIACQELLDDLTAVSRRLILEQDTSSENQPWDEDGCTETSSGMKSNERWGSVKTWMFGHVLSSSFARVSLSGRNSNNGSISSDCSDAMGKMDVMEKAVTASSSSYTSTCSSSRSSTRSSSACHHDWDLSYKTSSSTTLNDPKPEVVTDVVVEGLVRYSFEMCRIIGSGSYGTVLLCHEQADPSQLYAMKVIPKCKLSREHAERDAQRLLTEKKVLSTITHPFITKLYCAFETTQSLHYVMEYCAGGDMYYLLEKFTKNRLPESMVQFYAASIALALHCLHQHHVLYRDLKPENLLVDAQGFIRLADFGFAKQHVEPLEQRCTTFCGSADYIAPEVIAGEGYGLAADMWSFGCVLYELLTGFPPFYTPHDRRLLFRKITRTDPTFPSDFSPEMCDLLSKLLHKNPLERLGSGQMGMQEVFEHPFFATMDWYQLSIKHVVPPFVPTLTDHMDTTNFEPQFTSQEITGTVVYECRDESMASVKDATCRLFEDFDWCADTAAFGRC